MIRLGLDIDGCISEYPRLFSILTKALISSDTEVFIISSRENSNKSRKQTEQELKELGIFYNHLFLTDDKQQVIKENCIDLFIDNEIEQINSIKNSAVCCLLLREQMNYCWETDIFLGSKKTVRII